MTEELLDKLKKIEEKLDRLIEYNKQDSGSTTCPKCWMDFSGTNGYYCGQPGCPMQMTPWS